MLLLRKFQIGLWGNQGNLSHDVVGGSDRDLDQAVFRIVDVVFGAIVSHVSDIVVIDGQIAGGAVLIEPVVRIN